MSQALYEVTCHGEKHQIQVLGVTPFLLNHSGSYEAQFEDSEEALALRAISCLPPADRLEACQILVDSLDPAGVGNCWVLEECLRSYGPNLFNFDFSANKIRRIC